MPANTAIMPGGEHIDATSWRTSGYKNARSSASSSKWNASAYAGMSVGFSIANQGGANGPTSLLASYSTGRGVRGTVQPTCCRVRRSPSSPLTSRASQRRRCRLPTTLTTTGANNDNMGANLDYDDISFTGCGVPAPAPTIAKSFSPKAIVKDATSTLTFTIPNTAPGNQVLTGVTFSDALP